MPILTSENIDFKNIDTSNITNMSFLYVLNASAFNAPLDKWNVSNVKTMRAMFKIHL
ncbi:BspA family leucine-rich repeat surface protein [uncultured Helicobacter sp.]|uniref:BspA family leucine-rich repeat surface protein n=1 Tax=uncultured Helicobacter sp. TaxID=175537 RepID=UPI003457191E